jgi:hypothetical protein
MKECAGNTFEEELLYEKKRHKTRRVVDSNHEKE